MGPRRWTPWRPKRESAVADAAPVVPWGLGRDPGRVVVRAHEPVRLVFDRMDADPATDHVSFPDFGVVSTLVAFGRSEVELGERRAGRYAFYAASGRMRGSLVIEA